MVESVAIRSVSLYPGTMAVTDMRSKVFQSSPDPKAGRNRVSVTPIGWRDFGHVCANRSGSTLAKGFAAKVVCPVLMSLQPVLCCAEVTVIRPSLGVRAGISRCSVALHQNYNRLQEEVVCSEPNYHF